MRLCANGAVTSTYPHQSDQSQKKWTNCFTTCGACYIDIVDARLDDNNFTLVLTHKSVVCILNCAYESQPRSFLAAGFQQVICLPADIAFCESNDVGAVLLQVLHRYNHCNEPYSPTPPQHYSSTVFRKRVALWQKLVTSALTTFEDCLLQFDG